MFDIVHYYPRASTLERLIDPPRRLFLLSAVFDRFAECVLNGGVTALDKYTLHMLRLALKASFCS